MTRRRTTTQALTFESVALGSGSTIKDKFISGLLARCDVSSLGDDDAAIHTAHTLVGLRTFYGGTDGVELYYFNAGKRHSFGVVEWALNGGYKLIFHILNQSIVPVELVRQLPDLYNATFLDPLFAGAKLYYHGDHICLKRGTSWVPTHIDSTTNARHFVIVHSPDVVDNPESNHVTGVGPGRGDRWHTRFITITQRQTTGLAVSPLARRTVSQAVPSQETRFNPDAEVADIAGDQL